LVEGTRTTVGLVVPEPGVDEVASTCAPEQLVVATVAEERVTAGPTEEPVAAVAALDLIEARAGVDRIAAEPPCNPVITAT
jgi:hypothetical protein